MGISNLMKVDSSREAEVARKVVDQNKKDNRLHKAVDNDYNSRERLQDSDHKGHDNDREESVNKNLWNKSVDGTNRSFGVMSEKKIRGKERDGVGNDSNAAGGKPKFPETVPDAHVDVDATGEWMAPNYKIHAFYYPWYGSPEFDGTYLHWNHQLLPHWNQKEARKWPTGRWEPPGEIGANFYPELGPYSSRNPSVIEDHMKQLRLAGIGVLSMSWYPAGLSDEQGNTSDDLMPTYLDAANKYGIKV